MSTLFQNFEKQSKADWLAKVTKDLKGRAIEDLDWKLFEGFTVSPIAHQDDRNQQFPPISSGRKSNKWEIGVLVSNQNFSEANKEALLLLEQGATALSFVLEKTPSKENLSILLENIQHEWISTHFKIKQESWKRLTEHFLSVLLEKGQDPQKVSCSFEVKGSPVSEAKEIAHFQEILKQLPKGRFLVINTISRFAKKKKTIEALAETIFQGNQFLKILNENGLAISEIHSSVQFSIGLSDSYFLNIATIRALKLLWQQVIAAWDENLCIESPIIVHLGANTQTEDENYNKIKASAQAMSAVTGGADRLYVYPSDEFKSETNSTFSKRIALYTQHLMQMESYMDRVVDPAAGSYYIEELTERIAEASWKLFQERS